MARQVAHEMRLAGKHVPPVTSPTHQQRLPPPRPYAPEQSHLVGMLQTSSQTTALHQITSPGCCCHSCFLGDASLLFSRDAQKERGQSTSVPLQPAAQPCVSKMHAHKISKMCSFVASAGWAAIPAARRRVWGRLPARLTPAQQRPDPAPLPDGPRPLQAALPRAAPLRRGAAGCSPFQCVDLFCGPLLGSATNWALASPA